VFVSIARKASSVLQYRLDRFFFFAILTTAFVTFPGAVETNSLVSSETEMPYDYYSMPFCKPENGVKKSSSSTNPGTILLGIRIENSPYNFSMMVSLFFFTWILGKALKIVVGLLFNFMYNSLS
jgi:hypothetical protein